MRSRRIIIATIVIIACIGVGAVALTRLQQRAHIRSCGNYLTSIGYAARMWSNEHGINRFPPDLLSMSNELNTPKMLICPGDRSRVPPVNWAAVTPEGSSFEVITPSLPEADTNRVFLRCKVHGSVLYGDGSVVVRGKRHQKH